MWLLRAETISGLEIKYSMGIYVWAIVSKGTKATLMAIFCDGTDSIHQHISSFWYAQCQPPPSLN